MSQYKIPEWEINDIKLPFDFDDAETMDRYLTAMKQVQSDASTIVTEGTRADEIRSYCAVFDKMYDTIFGPGTADKIFQGRKNINLYDMTYDDFLEFVKRCRMTSQRNTNDRIQKYSGRKKRNKGKKQHS